MASFKFDFFNEKEVDEDAESLKRSGDNLAPIFGSTFDTCKGLSLPSGKISTEEIHQIVASPLITEKRDEHRLPDGSVIITLNGGVLSTNDTVAKNTDVLPGRYEGGLKIWECSFDAISCLQSLPPVENVLDLGCGAGLVGIWALKHWPQCNVSFHDLNEDVLTRATISNVRLNNGEFVDRSSFYFGTWGSSPELESDTYNLIVTADTLYDPETLASLCSIIFRVLVKGGKAIVAAKRFYFGVGGGVSSFMATAQKNGGFQARIITSLEDGASNIRDVLELIKV